MFAKSSTNRTDSNSTYSSCNSSDGNDDVGEEKYYSARTSFDDFVEGNCINSIKLNFSLKSFFPWIILVWNDADYETYASAEATKADKQYTFAEKLRDALRHSDTCFTDSTDDSYAVDISISGSRTDADEGIRYVHSLNAHIFCFETKSLFFQTTEYGGVAVVVLYLMTRLTKVFLLNRV